MPKVITRLKFYLLPIFLSLLIISISINNNATDFLSYNREQILTGEYWRIITSHFIHLSQTHLILNLLALFIIWTLVGKVFTQRQWLTLIVLLAIFISLSFLIFNPELLSYVGLSGVLHGILVAGTIVKIRKKIDYLLPGLITLKLIVEQTYGTISSHKELIGGEVIVDAHLYGSLVAVIIGMGVKLYSKYHLQEKQSNN